jgi:hypothetical protein
MAGALFVAAPVDGQVDGRCGAPYPPWYSAEIPLYGSDPGAPPLSASLDHRLLGRTADGSGLDTDADGIADHTFDDGGAFVIERGDGVVRLEPPTDAVPPDGLDLTVGVYVDAGIGDLDGDGRPELRASLTGSETNADFLVLGTVEPGTHRIDEVSVDLSTSLYGSGLGGTGDQDGDGIDDVWYRSEFEGSTHLLRGLDVVAPGPGAELAAVPPSFEDVNEIIVGLMDLDVEHPAMAGVDSPLDATRLELLGASSPIRLEIPDPHPGRGASGGVTANRFGSDRIVVFTQGYRNASQVTMWNLDDPCSRYAADAARDDPEPASPAAPAPGSADYTG